MRHFLLISATHSCVQSFLMFFLVYVRPFARLWWDETVPTVLTFPNLRNQVFSPSTSFHYYVTNCPAFNCKLNSCRQYYIQSRTVSSPYVSVQGCKAFLIIIGFVGQLKRGKNFPFDMLS